MFITHNGQKAEVVMLGRGKGHVTSDKLWLAKPLNALCLCCWECCGLRCFPCLEADKSGHSLSLFLEGSLIFVRALRDLQGWDTARNNGGAYGRISDPRGYAYPHAIKHPWVFAPTFMWPLLPESGIPEPNFKIQGKKQSHLERR